MPTTDEADLLDPRTAVAEGLDCLDAGSALVGAPAVADVAATLFERDRDERFDAAFDLVSDALGDATAGRADAVEFADRACESVQRTLLRQALQAEETETHVALVGVVENLRTGLAADPDEALGAACALGARLHEYAGSESPALSRDLLREAALCEYVVFEATGDPVERHPDSVAPVQLEADMRVYGAVLLYDRYDLSVETGASLAGERVADFEETVAAYTGDAVAR